MKAAVLHEIGKPLVIEDIPTPEPGPGEVLVRTMACGICATDLHISAGWGYNPTLPFVMGHEPAGVVHSAGPGAVGFQPGDRVVPNIFYTCGNCRYCRTNRETLCTALGGILGVLEHPGAYADYFTIPARQLFPLPDNVSFADGGVIADAVVCAVHAVRSRARVAPEDWVLVVGLGGVGLSVLQAARSAGARVIGTDVRDEKLDLAREMGALHTLDADDPEFEASVRELTDGEGVSVVFDCHGAEQTLRQGVQALARNGRLVIIGYTQETWPMAPQWMSRHELEIVGSRSGGRQDTADAIGLVAGPNWHSIVSDRFPLDRVNDALAFLRSGAPLGRVVVTFE